MITKLTLEGFKSFVYDTLELRKLTVLAGLNSSGKSSIIQALLMLEKAAKGEEFLLEGHGDLRELKNRYSQNLMLEAVLNEDETSSVVITEQQEVSSTQPAFPSIIHISAERFGPETSVDIFIGDNYKLGKRGENIFKCIEHYEREEIAPAIKHPDSEGDTFGFNLKAWLNVIAPNTKFDYFIQKKSDSSYATFNEYRAKNVGFGLSYTLPIITALLLGSITPNSLVILENPEAHLHPRGQTEIAKLIACCVQAGTHVIVETHSDHLLTGIRLFAKKDTEDFYKAVKCYWFEPDNQNNTTVAEIEINENGRFDDCPTGFFDQFEINASQLL
ncbi:MAG: DUF3696 domain-containing protein [Aureispira sp.]